MTSQVWADLPFQALMMVFAFVQSAIIGLESQARHKAAGFRTHILVGVAACLFTLVSMYGFEVNPSGRWDGSRIAAQIVSGIGFLGAGVIFLNRDVVRGLTTAASVWLVAAVGMSCGIGMPQLGVIALVLHLAAVILAPFVGRCLPDLAERRVIHVDYAAGRGTLRHILQIFEEKNLPFRVVSTRKSEDGEIVHLVLTVDGWNGTTAIQERLASLGGVQAVSMETDSS